MTVPSNKDAESHCGENTAESLPCVKDYRLVRCIGKGGFGSVYLAHDLMDHPCALKVVTRESLGGYSYDREYDSLRSYIPFSDKHPNLLRVRHVGTGDGFFYYTMPIADDKHGRAYDPETYEPKTLADLMPEPGAALPVREAIEMAIPVLDALAFLHSQNLLHRDVKPSNILVSDSRLVLGDIGLLTRPREDLTCVCSPGFAPAGSVKDPSGDLYSVGMILQESVGGDVSATGLSIPTVQCDAPDPLYAKLNKVIQKARSLKYKSAAAMKKDLLKIADKNAKSARKRQASAGSNRADPIELKYEETGGRHGFLGKPQERTRKCADGAGKCRRFRNKDNIDGAIFWHPETGAFELHGEILKRWSDLGGTTSILGYPVSDEQDITAETYARGVLAEPAFSGDGGSDVIGRGNWFRNGCVIRFSSARARKGFGESVVLFRPVSGPWSMVRRCNAARVFIKRTIGVIRSKDANPSLDFSPVPALQRITDACNPPSTSSTENEAAVEVQRTPSVEPGAATPVLELPPAAESPEHPASHLLYGADPKWEMQTGPESFSWAGCGGHLFKMTASYTFFEGKNTLNDDGLSKIRVAVFLPSGHGPETPLFYALADMATAMESVADILPDVLQCGFGFVAMDTPLTGICQPGVDMHGGGMTGKDAGFGKAYKRVAGTVGAKNMTLEFAYHAQRFTARNLWLTRLFIEREFGIVPAKTVLSGCCTGAASAGFAFNASGFGDMLLGFGAAPTVSGEFLRKMLPSFFSQLRFLFRPNAPCPGGEYLRLLDPAAYAESVHPPREVHVLRGYVERSFPIDLEVSALEKCTKLRMHDGCDYRFTEAVRANWGNALGLRFGPGIKSMTLLDGGDDFKGWRGEFRTVFLNTALRSLRERP